MLYQRLILLCAILTVFAQAAPPVTRVYIPAMGLTADVVAVTSNWAHGDYANDDWTLAAIDDQVGWLDPSGGPAQSGPGNTVLVGHYSIPPSGAPGAFFNLAKLGYGDVITVQHPDGTTWDYRVIKTSIVDDNDLSVVYDNDDGRLTLIGCPGTDYAHRLVVVAEPVGRVICIPLGESEPKPCIE